MIVFSDNICHDFTYDVSKNFNNYQLRMVSLGKKYNIPFFDVKLSNTLKKVFGVTPSLQILSSSEIHKLMRKNRFDILLESHIVTPSTRSEEIFSIAFPIRYYSVVIVTNNRGLMTPLEKIYNYYGYLIVISTAVILGITFVIIYFHTRNLTFAVFEILRLLINNEIYTPMKTTSIRIFFTTIFLYFLIIHGTFGGRLAEFLTRNEFRKNVETLEDLKDPRYNQIYTYQHARHYIKDPELSKKTDFNNFNCKEKIQNNASVACINDLVKLLPVIGELDLHQPKKVVHTGYYVQLVRKNSPFKTKINDLMIILMHSGLAQKWTNDKIADEMRGIKIKKARALIYYRPIDFDDLYFSFVLLGLGLLCSATSFVTELFLKKFLVREKQKRARGRWNVPKVLVQLKQKNSSDDFQVGTGGPRYCWRWRNIFRRVLRSFTRYLLRHW